MAIDFGKKVAGVPVVYLAAGAAAIAGVVAWRMKPASEGSAEEVSDATAESAADPYAGFETSGTVVVQPATPVTPEPPERPDTNDEWIKEGAEWLVATKNVPGPAAYTALSKYVDGSSRSTQEAQYVEWVIKEKGFPPDRFEETPLPAPATPTPTPAPTPTGYRGYGWIKADGKTSGQQYADKYKISVTLFYTFNPTQPRVPRLGSWLKVRANSNPLTGYAGK